MVRMRGFLVLFLILCSLGLAGSIQGQSSKGEGRKVVRRIDPIYPAMAKQMNIAGTVRVLAVVAQDGNVKAVEPVGGSPLLVQVSEDAIKRWKFAPATAESKELIELHFHQP
jgi:TonB family protein